MSFYQQLEHELQNKQSQLSTQAFAGKEAELFLSIPGVFVDNELFEEAYNLLLANTNVLELQSSSLGHSQNALYFSYALDYLHKHAPHFNYRALWQQVANYIDWIFEKNDPTVSLTADGLYHLKNFKRASTPIELQVFMIYTLERIMPLTRNSRHLENWLHKARTNFLGHYSKENESFLADSLQDFSFNWHQLWALSLEVDLIPKGLAKKILDFIKTKLTIDDQWPLSLYFDAKFQIEDVSEAKTELKQWIKKIELNHHIQLESIAPLNHLIKLCEF